MLSALSIRNLVLIEAADIEFAGGLSVLTGETGAGKSMMLDGLELVLGGRGERSLVRSGADLASVTATFEIGVGHAALPLIAAAGIALSAREPLILRRTLAKSGQSRAFINDAAVSLQLLKSIGETLVEIHGQNDDRGLLDPRGHRDLLDAFAGADALAGEVAEAHAAWWETEAAAAAHADARAKALAEQDYLSAASEELRDLAPTAGEEASLAAERTLRLNSAKIAGDVEDALDALTEGGLESRLAQALRKLERAGKEARALLEPATKALERTSIELREAVGCFESALTALKHDPQRLSAVEERLFALRAAARKYRVGADELARKREEIEQALDAVRGAEKRETDLAAAVAAAERGYRVRAETLSRRRKEAAAKLDAAVNRELAPLKLGKAEFTTSLEAAEAGPGGTDRAEFRVRTNPGTPAGTLTKIASGGEMARFILALKVVLARSGSPKTLVFDEVDRGIGGAVADAVGERLAKLASSAQVLVVTHSPQVAARAGHHFLVEKSERKGMTSATIRVLGEAARREEIARMLSGSAVTDEARAAARSLLAGATDAPPARKGRKSSAA